MRWRKRRKDNINKGIGKRKIFRSDDDRVAFFDILICRFISGLQGWGTPYISLVMHKEGQSPKGLAIDFN